MFGTLKNIGAALSAATSTKLDISSILKLVDQVPGLPTQELNEDTLAHSLAIIQLGTATIFFTFDDASRTNVKVVRMAPVKASEVNTAERPGTFLTFMLSEEQGNQSTVYMTLNRENLAKNHNKITSDAIVRAIMVPVENVPLIGNSLKGLAQGPLIATCDFLIDTIYSRASAFVNTPSGPGADKA